MTREDPEAFLRSMLAPLSAVQPGRALPGVPFSREAVANAFVMLGLLPEARAEEILAGYRTELEAKGFRFGVLTGELSVRPGAHGYQDAQAAGRGDLTGIPLAVAAGPVPLPVPDGSTAAGLNLIWATLTPGGAKLRFSGTTLEGVRPPQPGRRPYVVWSSQGLAEEMRSGLSVTDDLGRRYRLRPGGWMSGPIGAGQPGRRWDGEMLAEPEPAGGRAEPGAAVSWLEFAAGSRPSVRVAMPAAAEVPTGTAEPPWPTPSECYLAQLSPVTSMTIGADGATAELDTAEIVAAVADALLWVGALPHGSALLAGGAQRPAGARRTAAGVSG